MADPQQTAAGLQIPPEVQEKFAPLLELIKASESMNNEERQYWINILPIMTPDQTKNLEEILQNERQQLAAIDVKYSKEMTAIGSNASVATIEQQIKSKKRDRQEQEDQASVTEQQKEEDLLKQIQSL